MLLLDRPIGVGSTGRSFSVHKYYSSEIGRDCHVTIGVNATYLSISLIGPWQTDFRCLPSVSSDLLINILLDRGYYFHYH